MTKKRLFIGIISLGFLILLGGIAYLIWPQPSMAAIPVDMKLHASVVSKDGKVQETFEFSAKGEIRTDEDEKVVFDGKFDNAGSSFRFELDSNSGPIPFIHSQYPSHNEYPDHGAFTARPYVYDTEKNAARTFQVAMDVEAGCIIFRWRDYTGTPYTYIVASVDENKTPQEILDYFSWFL